MNAKKHIILGIIILVLLAVSILSGCIIINLTFKKPNLDFSKLIKNENIDNLSLTIYYMDPYAFTEFPLDVDDLIKLCKEEGIGQRIIIRGSDLEDNIGLFMQIDNHELTSVKKRSFLNARLYYIFESRENGKLFDVAMWGGNDDDNSIFINGVEVKENTVFYDIIMPFLPEDIAKKIEAIYS